MDFLKSKTKCIILEQYVTTNQWNHVAITYDGYAIRLYLNSELDFEHIVSDNFSSDYGNFYIAQSHIGNELFDGQIDNINVWNIALSENEIQDYMNCPPTGNEEGLIGYWNFDEVSENMVNDLSGNGNNGTINGATCCTDVPQQSCQLTTVNGCDSIANLNLLILASNSSTDTIIECDSYTWINGITYTESNYSAFHVQYDPDSICADTFSTSYYKLL